MWAPGCPGALPEQGPAPGSTRTCSPCFSPQRPLKPPGPHCRRGTPICLGVTQNHFPVSHECPHLALRGISDMTDNREARPIHFHRHFNLDYSIIIPQIRLSSFLSLKQWICRHKNDQFSICSLSVFAFVCKLLRGKCAKKICSKGCLDQEIRTVSIFKNRFFIPHVIPRHCEKATYIAMHSELKDFLLLLPVFKSLCKVIATYVF